MSHWPSWVGSALVSCLREQTGAKVQTSVGALLDHHDPVPLAAAAAAHHVESCVYASVRGLPAAARILPSLRASNARHRRHQLRLKADLHTLARLLEDTGATWMVVKGPYLDEIAYRQRGLRDYVDLDIVVTPGDFPAVVRELRVHGYDVVGRDWALASRQLAGEIDLVSPVGTPVDLHWALLYHGDLRRRFSLGVEQMLGRARTATIAGTTVRVPDPADALIHLTVHAFREGGVRLQWLSDLDQVVRHDPPDWPTVVARSREGGVGLVAGTLLLRTSRLLGTPVPPDVVDALLPRGWRTLVRITDQMSPPQRSIAHGTLGSLLTRSTCADPRATTSRLAASCLDVVRGRRRAPMKPGDTVVDDRDPRNSPRELDRYLNTVATVAEA